MMLCPPHTHPQLAHVVIVGVGLYTVVSSLFFIVIGSRSRRPNSFLCTSLATFRYAASTLFSMEAFLLLGLFQVTSYYCVSPSSVRCGRCVVRVLSLVVAHIFIKCYPSRTSSGGFCRKVTYATMAVGYRGFMPGPTPHLPCVTSAQ